MLILLTGMPFLPALVALVLAVAIGYS